MRIEMLAIGLALSLLAASDSAQRNGDAAERLVQQTNQLFERMQRANEQRRSLITLSQGMDEAIRQMRDPSSMQAAMDRSAHLDRAYEMLGTADHAINTLWHVLTVFTVITCQPDRKRTGPGVARLHDGMLRQADSSIEFVERRILLGMADMPAATDAAMQSIREYRDAQDIMRAMRF